jgi:hypothetical protein
MPVEIRELLIQAKMNKADENSTDNLIDDSFMEKLDQRQQQLLKHYKGQIIRECMEQVEKLLKQQKDR